MQSNRYSDSFAKIFQVFLNKLVDNSQIIITKQIYSNHEAIFTMKALEEDEPNNKPARGSSLVISLGKVVMNNILALHILLIDQSKEVKDAMMEKHSYLLTKALVDIFIDYYEHQKLEDYKRISAEEFDGIKQRIKVVIKEFVGNCINPNFDSLSLKNFLIKYSTIGLERSSINDNLLMQLIQVKHHPRGVFRSLAKAHTVSYGKGEEVNLISQLEQLTVSNLDRLGLESQLDKAAYQQLQAVWEAFRSQQYKEFRQISYMNKTDIMATIMLSMLIFSGLFFIFGMQYIILGLAGIAATKHILDFYTIYNYDRIILPQYRNKYGVFENRNALKNFIVRHYKPKNLKMSLAAVTDHSTTRTITDSLNNSFTVTYYEPEFDVPTRKIKRKMSTQKVSTSTGMAGASMPSHDAAPNLITWKRLADNTPYVPPVPYYPITNATFTNPHFGFITEKAFEKMLTALPAKKAETIRNNPYALFKFVSAKGHQGIVVFSKRLKNKVQEQPHSKIKLKGMGIEGRVIGTRIAVGTGNEQLICYDRYEAPKHKKKSH